MAESIVRLRVDSQEYDNKLKRAAEALNKYAEGCRKAGGTLEHVDEGVLEYARSLGKMETVSASVKGKLNEMTKAFNETYVQYKQLTDAEKASPYGKALSESLDQLKDRVQETKTSLKEAADILNGNSGGGEGGGGGITGMLQVFGGNMLTKGVSMLTSELTDAWTESIKLAREGEGVRLAFERLNQPGLLDNLKEATHGTVSEVELMKQAIKFENFKLPLEDLATYLQFAQQKAKDTGESIDFLVNSIVNGLGRQSKQILDNLGISASELTKRMAEGKDMTQAVAEIIREEMAKAGDYVETAADRAARATAKATDEMEKFGQSASPIAEAFNSLWTDIKNGALGVANMLLGPVANSILSIQRLLNTTLDDRRIQMFEKFDQIAKQQQAQSGYKGMGSLQSVTAPGGYVVVSDKDGNVLHQGHYDNNEQRQAMWNSWNTKRSGGRSGGKKTPSVQDYLNMMYGNMDDSLGSSLKGNPDKYFQPVWKMIGEAGRKQIAGMADKQWDYGKDISKTGNNTPKDIKRMSEGMTKYIDTSNKMLGGISSIASGVSSMGIELPKEIQGVLGGIQGVMSILSGIATIVAVIEALTTIQTTESTIKSIPVVGWALAGGGIVHAADGYTVPGNHYSGDMVPAMLNSGELVLNKAQQGVLASQLQGGGLQNLKLDGVVTGENIHIVHNRYLKRSGQGELVTW